MWKRRTYRNFSDEDEDRRRRKRRFFIFFLLLALVLIGGVIGLVVGLTQDSQITTSTTVPTTTTTTTTTDTTTTTTTTTDTTTTDTIITTTPVPIFSLTCPFDNVLPGLALDPADAIPAVLGNAMYIATNPCANLSLTYVDSPVTGFLKRNVIGGGLNLTSFPPMYPIPSLHMPSIGFMKGHVNAFSKRSLTNPLDFTALVGYFNTTFSFNTSFNTAFRMGYASVATDGIFRYFINVGMEMTKIVQHDYYNLDGNVAIINVGEIFNTSSPCYMHVSWTNTSHYQRRMRSFLGRFSILYVPLDVSDNATVFCLVISNTNDISGGGAYGYEIPITYPVIGLTRLDIGIYKTHYKITFDALGEPQVGGVNAARYANVYILNATALFNMEFIVHSCSGMQSLFSGRQDYSLSPVHDGDGICEQSDLYGSEFMGIRGLDYMLQLNQISDFSTCAFNGQQFFLYSGPIPVSDLNISTASITATNGVLLDAGLRSIQSTCGIGTRYTAAITYNLDSLYSGIAVFGSGIGNTSNFIFDLSQKQISIFGGTPMYGASLYGDQAFYLSFYQVSNQTTSTNFMYIYQTRRDIITNRTFIGDGPMTMINNVNLINVGIDTVPNKFEFTLSGMRNSTAPGAFDMTNQNLIIMSENMTRTFTLSDSCQSVSCTQRIYLRSTNYNGPPI